MLSPAGPLVTQSDRLDVLDVLRGIALFGMFLVHFNNYSADGIGLAGVYQQTVRLLFEERFWAIFGMLFGVGFAIQFRRADARGERFVRKCLRRLLGLAAFGFIAHAVADAALSRWWLKRFRYGPLEWLWRSITLARWQLWRAEAARLTPQNVASV